MSDAADKTHPAWILAHAFLVGLCTAALWFLLYYFLGNTVFPASQAWHMISMMLEMSTPLFLLLIAFYEVMLWHGRLRWRRRGRALSLLEGAAIFGSCLAGGLLAAQVLAPR